MRVMRELEQVPGVLRQNAERPFEEHLLNEPDDQNPPDEDFATMFAASIKGQAKRLAPGQAIEGTIVAIGAEVAFVNVGGKGEATIALDELRDDDGALEAGIGDRIQATLVSTAGGLTLSRKLQRGAATARQIEDAYRSGLPVEGKVERAVKAGFEVSIAKQRAFCPLSQIDTMRHADPAVHEGRVYTFRILEYADNGRKFVVSRRAVLEAEQQARAAEVRRTITPGAVLSGQVVSVRDFGAFVDLGGGVQGLIHVSEMDWGRVADTAAVVAPGQDVSVKVLRVDETTGQIALGLKQLTADPWSSVQGAGSAIVPGAKLTGTVERHAKFGVFVTLAPGVTGLLPSSETGVGQDQDLRKAFPIGREIDVVVLEVDAASRRIRLSITAVARAQEAAEVREYTEREGSGQTQSLGSLADKLRGALGSREK
jgi:small subunit ribosomal protein S1